MIARTDTAHSPHAGIRSGCIRRPRLNGLRAWLPQCQPVTEDVWPLGVVDPRLAGRARSASETKARKNSP